MPCAPPPLPENALTEIALRESKAGVLLSVRVQPRSRKDGVLGARSGVLRIEVCAVPADGQANAAVVEVVAKALGCARSTLHISHGEKSRDKTICIAALSIAAYCSNSRARLTALLASD